MKKLGSLILLSLFFMIGCQDDSSILEPQSDLSFEQLPKGRPILGRDLDDDLYLWDDSSSANKLEDNYLMKDVDFYNFSNEDGDESPIFRDMYTVDGSKGAILYFYKDFLNEKGEYGRLNAVLTIPSGAFVGKLTFNIEFFLNNYSMELSPTPFAFDKPVRLDLLFYNVDLDKSAESLEFAYIEGLGESVNYSKQMIDVKNGNILIWGAELHHFSRYGWTRSRESLKDRTYFNEE